MQVVNCILDFHDKVLTALTLTVSLVLVMCKKENVSSDFNENEQLN
jgi:hypothetical protein